MSAGLLRLADSASRICEMNVTAPRMFTAPQQKFGSVFLIRGEQTTSVIVERDGFGDIYRARPNGRRTLITHNRPDITEHVTTASQPGDTYDVSGAQTHLKHVLNDPDIREFLYRGSEDYDTTLDDLPEGRYETAIVQAEADNVRDFLAAIESEPEVVDPMEVIFRIQRSALVPQ